MDEFGKGSAETDGIGLLVASMAQLRRLGARALVTTHFLVSCFWYCCFARMPPSRSTSHSIPLTQPQEIFHEGLIPREIADQICFRMDVYVPPAQLPPPAQAAGPCHHHCCVCVSHLSVTTAVLDDLSHTVPNL